MAGETFRVRMLGEFETYANTNARVLSYLRNDGFVCVCKTLCLNLTSETANAADVWMWLRTIKDCFI